MSKGEHTPEQSLDCGDNFELLVKIATLTAERDSARSSRDQYRNVSDEVRDECIRLRAINADLLAACKEAASQFAVRSTDSDDRWRARKQLLAAIAKAEGKS